MNLDRVVMKLTLSEAGSGGANTALLKPVKLLSVTPETGTGNGGTAKRHRDGADRPGGGVARGVDGGPLRKLKCPPHSAAGKTTHARPPAHKARERAVNFGIFPAMGRV